MKIEDPIQIDLMGKNMKEYAQLKKLNAGIRNK
jgi:hypothetical protein